MMGTSPNERLLKIVVGLALESALIHGHNVKTLDSLYSYPVVGRVRELHDQLLSSDDHLDRELAIWLELALERKPIRSDPMKLVSEMREMEFVLFMLIGRSGEAQRKVNDWMNYIINAAHSLEGGFWIDAKIMLSLGLQTSQHPSVEQLKSDPGLAYEIDVLQRATRSYFEEVKEYPLSLRVPESRLDVILDVQEVMLDMMRTQFDEEHGGTSRRIWPSINRLSSTIRCLMDEESDTESVRRRLRRALEYLEMGPDPVEDGENRGDSAVFRERIAQIIETL